MEKEYTTEKIIELTEECNNDKIWMKKVWIPIENLTNNSSSKKDCSTVCKLILNDEIDLNEAKTRI